jgi:glutathione S-transferase
MYKLHGFALSNYYNLVKLALLEKGLPFEEVAVFPPAKPDFLQKSPMGKIPCLEVGTGCYLTESQVILDYLEETHPEPAFYPEDPFARAKVRELMRVMELYLELPARRLYPAAFFGGAVSEETRNEVRGVLEKACDALQKMAHFDAYLTGDMLTWADLAAVIHLPVVSLATRRVYGENLLATIPGMTDYLERLRARPTVQALQEAQNRAASQMFKRPS